MFSYPISKMDPLCPKDVDYLMLLTAFVVRALPTIQMESPYFI